MEQKIIYTALFVDSVRDLLVRFPPKHTKIFAHHFTIAFRPPTLEGIDIGKKHVLKIVGRIFDSKGDVLLVECPTITNKYPHITISCADNVAPAYSKELIEKFYESGQGFFENPDTNAEVSLTEGFFDGAEDIISV